MPKSMSKTARSWSSVHLNAIRGAAALIVLLGHTRGLFFTSFTDSTATTHVRASASVGRPTVGEEAVIVFFVLSGYLVGGSVLRSVRNATWSWKEYLVKRITRLWVVLLPALGFGVALDIIGIHIIGTNSSIYAAPASTLVPQDLAVRLGWKVIAANAFFLQGILSPTAGTNNSLWSLAYEWWYYLMFPVAVLIFARGTRRWLRGIYAVLLIGMAAFIGRDMIALFPAWLLGVVVAAMPLVSVSRAVVIPLLGVSMSFILLAKRLELTYYGAAWCVAIAFAVILWCAVRHSGECSNDRYRKTSSFMSDISYTLYLMHLPLAIFLCAFINRPWHYRALTLESAALFFLMNMGIVGAAYLFYCLFERNTDRIRGFLVRNGRVTAKKPRTATCGAAEKEQAKIADADMAVTAYD